MIIKALCMAYNEEFLLPFFLRHYISLDEIHLIIDADTNDRSREIASEFKNVTMEEFKFPDGMDDFLKVEKLNEAAQKMETDWLYVVDADELIWPHLFWNAESFLKRQNGNVVMAKMWQVFRHKDDEDLKLYEPVVLQRRHGDPTRGGLYDKPIVIKMPLNFTLGPGNHTITASDVRICEDHYDGAHWAMADPCFAVERRVKNRRDRQSQVNLKNMMTWQHHNITEKQILEECARHLNDPQLF